MDKKDCLKPIIREGYSPGLISSITRMHIEYYNRLVGFDAEFEIWAAQGTSDFFKRRSSPDTRVWYVEYNNCICGSIAIDGEDLEGDVAHLRWFIIEDSLRGQGYGNELIANAVSFCDAREYKEVHLWSFRGLDPARHLYEKYGFTLDQEYRGSQWGKEMWEQKYVRLKDKIG